MTLVRRQLHGALTLYLNREFNTTNGSDDENLLVSIQEVENLFLFMQVCPGEAATSEKIRELSNVVIGHLSSS